MLDTHVDKSLQGTITSNGGEIKRAVNDTVDYLISTQEDVDAGTAKVRCLSPVVKSGDDGLSVEAQVASADKNTVPIVSDAFITAALGTRDLDAVDVAKFTLQAGAAPATSD